MYEIAKALEVKFGWRITYEDPPIENAAELRDATSPSYKATHPDPKDVTLVPKARPFTFTWNSDNRDYNRRDMLDQCVNEHNRLSQNPGQFVTYHRGDISHIIPSKVRRKDGLKAHVKSPMDSIVTFPVEERTLIQTISLILSAVESQTGSRISVGMVPAHVMNQRIAIGAGV